MGALEHHNMPGEPVLEIFVQALVYKVGKCTFIGDQQHKNDEQL